MRPVVTQEKIKNPLLESNLDRLARYGFRQANVAETDTAATDWARLKGDFARADEAAVPEFDQLPPAVQEAALHYIALKREADTLLSTCETAHGEILNQGLSVPRVEDYAVVRDAYEDKVEEFGAARAAVAGLLDQSPAA